jgi:hypothetical protein
MSDAQDKLKEMSLAERIAAVAADIESKRDEFRSIGPYELAELLGIGDADQPGGDWGFVWYAAPRTVEDIFAVEDDEYILDLIESAVTPERWEELKAKVQSMIETSRRPENLDFISETEKQAIARLDMERQRENDTKLMAYYYINAPHDRTLTFEAYVGDNGETYGELQTPYDEHDGKFTDLSDCLIVEEQ